MEADGFYTMKGYSLLSEGNVTSAMEDYLEMILRTVQSGKAVRVGELSASLHVKAPSVTKMVRQLSHAGFVSAEKYGDIRLTGKGRQYGEYLLYRHEVLHRFLCFVNHSENELEQVEKIEHFFSEETVRNLEKLLDRQQNKHSENSGNTGK